jgi:predicted DNA-binding protein YlxM (UPF0122 family)
MDEMLPKGNSLNPQFQKKKLAALIDKKDNSTGKVDIAQALKLRFKNRLTFQEIANHFGVTRQAVNYALRKYVNVLNRDIGAYKDIKADLLSAVEMEMLQNMLDSDKIKGASLNNIAYAFQQVFNANRLESGQSLSNDVHAVIINMYERRQPQDIVIEGDKGAIEVRREDNP